jgi:hypothetical protein
VNLCAFDIVTVTVTLTVTVTVTVSLGQFRNQLPLCHRTHLPIYLETIYKRLHVSIVKERHQAISTVLSDKLQKRYL